MKLIKCTNCGEVFKEAIGPCKICGGIIELSIALTGIGAESSVGKVGNVIETRSNNSHHIKYTAPSGTQSESSLSSSELIGFVKSPIDIGRPGENRVITCIKNHLTKTEKSYREIKSQDNLGEDGVLIIGNEKVIIQIVTMKPNDTFWKDVVHGKGEFTFNLNEAASRIMSTISRKARHYKNKDNSTKNMLLAIDVGHFGTLASSEFTDLYLSNYMDPATEFGFGAVWLIGPTENNIFYLGTSHW